MKFTDIERELKIRTDPVRAKFSQKFFNTQKGGYAEGDIFLGLSVPVQRKIAKQYASLPLSEIKKLLISPIHEFRFTALEILVYKYETSTEVEKGKIAEFYLRNKKYVNNWDLVDTSAPYILGDWLLGKDKSILYKLADSKNVWDKRIAIVSTYWFIKHEQIGDTFKLAEVLLKDKHHLIHKSVGWMLREAGKKSNRKLEIFITRHVKKMPRTMLRYAIEKLPQEKRIKYLNA
jgi:3-methyladenine DNA glycosylase AlkD